MRELRIPDMPELWQMDEIWFDRSALLGSLAKWAVRLSPYRAPAWLEVGLEQFDREWPFEDWTPMRHGDFTTQIFNTIQRCPTIMGWNQPRKGVKDYAVHALIEPPEPDVTYIDLIALAKCVAQDVILEERIRRAQDELHGFSYGGKPTPHDPPRLGIGGYS
jgi:hypothetical protein